MGCCPDTGALIWINEHDKVLVSMRIAIDHAYQFLGQCYPKGHRLSYDAGIRPAHEECCFTGSHIPDGKCVQPTHCGNGYSERRARCANYPVCSSHISPDTRYGYCYIISFGDWALCVKMWRTRKPASSKISPSRRRMIAHLKRRLSPPTSKSGNGTMTPWRR